MRLYRDPVCIDLKSLKFNHGTATPSNGTVSLNYKKTGTIKVFVGRIMKKPSGGAPWDANGLIADDKFHPVTYGIAIDYLVPIGSNAHLKAKGGFFV